MKTNRRSFIRYSALASTSLIAQRSMGSWLAGRSIVGMQLYCVRDEMKNDPLNTLKGLAAMGYKHVEHANYVDGKFYGYTPAEFKSLLASLGMDMPSGHTVLRPDHWDAGSKQFTKVWLQTIEDAAFMGQRFMISPSMDGSTRKSYDALMSLLELYNKTGEICKKHGMMFGYHNHDFEFSEKLNGRSLYDTILAETDPALVMQQLDTGNLFNGGVNAMAIVRQYPARFLSLHVKDAVLRAGDATHYESTVLGKGVADIKALLAVVKKQGKHPDLIIEQEAYQGIAPMECMRQNLAIMKQWGYA